MIEGMVALMMWLLVVAVIGSLIVVGVVRPARRSGQRASTVFTRRQAAKERARLEQPARSADERLASSRQVRGRAPRSAPAPAARRTVAVRPVTPPLPAPHRIIAEPIVPLTEPKPAPAAPTPVVASAQQPDLFTPAPVASDDSVIDARTRWARAESEASAQAGSVRAAEPLRPQPEPLRPQPERLRRAE